MEKALSGAVARGLELLERARATWRTNAMRREKMWICGATVDHSGFASLHVAAAGPATVWCE
jgi:hypothetical protein